MHFLHTAPYRHDRPRMPLGRGCFHRLRRGQPPFGTSHVHVAISHSERRIDDEQAAMNAKRTFAADATSLREVRDFIRGRAREASLRPPDTEDLVQAVSEICANAVVHTSGRRFDVSWTARPGMAEVEVQDEGVFAPTPGVFYGDRVGGFGLPLAAALVDEVTIARGTSVRPGTTVRLVKHPAFGDASVAARESRSGTELAS